MRVDEVLGFNEYHGDPRFTQKKPNIRGSWRQIPGDNMYYLDGANVWRQEKTIYHTDAEDILRDLRHPKVFISRHYFYFGANARSVPQFSNLVHKGRGVKCDHDDKEVSLFIEWLQKKFPVGILGTPRDRRGRMDCPGAN